ncbi:MAG: SurA N-terminal domain-containing protein [Deltaproteobacteria bacterium]|nr:SurA N-terminal domain-containing protein [Deltaproteobacteria bacterium]
MFGLISILSFVGIISAFDSKPLSEKIEARVGSEIITSTDLDLLVEAMKAATPADEKVDFRQKALQALIDQTLMSQYLAKLNMQVSDRDVDQRINSIRSSNGIQDSTQFRELLEKQGMTFERFRTQLRKQMEQMQFANLIRRQAVHTIEDKELLSYYKAHADIYKSTPEIELQECVVPVKKTEAEAIKSAEFYIKNPKKFSECIKKYSDASGPNSGALGKFRRGSLREDVEAKVFNLKSGEVTMMKAPNGIQLLKVTKITNLGAQKFEDVKEQIREHIENEIVQKEFQKTLSELKSSTFIKI